MTNSFVNRVAAPGVITGVITLEGNLPTYRAGIKGLSLHATPNGVFTMIGSASKLVVINRIRVSGAAVTASQDIPYDLKKCSTAPSGGTSTTLTDVPLDSLDAAASAVLKAYTVDPTLGTLVGIVGTGVIPCALATAADQPQDIDVFAVTGFGKGLRLNSATESIALDLLGVTLANATTLNIEVEWTEQ